MSDQSRDKKDEAQDSKALWELSEETWLEETWLEGALPEELWTEGSQPEQAQTEGLQPVQAQTEGLQPVQTQTEGLQPVQAQTEGLQPVHSGHKKSRPPAPKKAKRNKTQLIIMIVMIPLAVIMVIMTALVLLHNRWVKKPSLPSAPTPAVSGSVPSATIPSLNPGSSQNPEVSPDPMTTDEVITVEPLAGGERRSEDFFTVLIFGADKTSGLTDTIMVASYDVTNQKATVMSIPRDTLINNAYLDKGNKSINATYKQNGKGETGAAALKTEVSRLIGFVPDFYVTINWELVGQMVEAIGGVYFDVPYHMGYDDPTQNLHIHFEKGYQYLDGEAAMNLVRWRKNNDGIPSGSGGSDLSRLNVQHDFLKAVLKQTLQPQNIIHVPDLIRLFNENVVSDLSVENMLWFGEQAVIGGLGVDDVSFLTMPVRGAGGGRYNGKVCPIADRLLKIINESLNPYVEEVTMRQLDLIQINPGGNTLYSTTGTLRNPASGVYESPNNPATSNPPVDDPEISDPPVDDPEITDPPVDGPEVTDPPEDGPEITNPPEDGPEVTDPPVDGPEATDPPVDSPGPDQTDDPSPEPGPTETGGGGPDDGAWGDTSE